MTGAIVTPMSASTASDLDLRLVRYFIVVAEHGNLGRAADALHIAQPSLSRQLQRLEVQVGARLLDRTPRGTTLTAAGSDFLAHARRLLQTAERAVTSARSVTAPESIVVGHSGNVIVTPAVAELRRRHPLASIQTRALMPDAIRDALFAEEIDVAVSRMPFDEDSLEVEQLYEEDRVLVMPIDHPLAARETVTLADFAGEPLVRVPDAAGDAWWRIDPRPDGSRAPDGPVARAAGDKFEFVASGQALLVMPPGPASSGFREDLTQRRIIGIPRTPVVLATRLGERRALVDEFRELARELLRETVLSPSSRG